MHDHAPDNFARVIQRDGSMKCPKLLKFVVATVVSYYICSAQPILAETAVDRHGNLRTNGAYLVNDSGNIVQLHGMSFYWSRSGWGDGLSFYNEATVKTLVSQWNCNVVRVAYAQDSLGNSYGIDAVESVIKAAINAGIYVIIDWHSHWAERFSAKAITFFKEQATKYKSTPNVIFEPYNEPINGAGNSMDGTPAAAEVTWKLIKPYLQEVTQAIRDAGAENLVVVGTPYFCQFVNVAASQPLKDKNGKPFSNLAYSFHFYAASHGPDAYFVKNDPEKKGGMESSYLSGALGKIPIFITEWGTTHSDGGQQVDAANTMWWFDRFINGPYHLSSCNWSASGFEMSSAFSGSASTASESGKIVQKLLKAQVIDEFLPPAKTGSEGSAKDTVFSMPATHPMARYNRIYGGNFSLTNITVPYASRDNNDTRSANHTCIPVLGTASGDWISYFVNNTVMTRYIVVRHLAKNGTGTIDIQIKGKSVGILNIRKDSTWVSSVTPANIAPGTDTIKFVVTSSSGDGFLLEWFELTGDSSAVHHSKPAVLNSPNCLIDVLVKQREIKIRLPIGHTFSKVQLFAMNGRSVMRKEINKATQYAHFTTGKGLWVLEFSGTSGVRQCYSVVVE